MALILVVDDSSFQRQNIRSVVAAEGHEVIEANNGREALHILSQKKVDCILMDLIMPEISGMAILKDLNRQKFQVPVIVITADLQKAVRDQCRNLGAISVLNKPLNAPELVGALQNVLCGPDSRP